MGGPGLAYVLSLELLIFYCLKFDHMVTHSAEGGLDEVFILVGHVPKL